VGRPVLPSITKEAPGRPAYPVFTVPSELSFSTVAVVAQLPFRSVAQPE
jgi:hypothetical protein